MQQSGGVRELSEVDLEAVCELIQSAKEECRILRNSAGYCRDSRLNELLIEISNERGCFAFELEGIVERHGVVPAVRLVRRSAFQLAVQQLQALMRKGDIRALLQQCELQEDHILKRYAKAMKKAAPADMFSILKRQYERVRLSRRKLRQWMQQN